MLSENRHALGSIQYLHEYRFDFCRNLLHDLRRWNTSTFSELGPDNGNGPLIAIFKEIRRFTAILAVPYKVQRPTTPKIQPEPPTYCEWTAYYGFLCHRISRNVYTTMVNAPAPTPWLTFLVMLWRVSGSSARWVFSPLCQLYIYISLEENICPQTCVD